MPVCDRIACERTRRCTGRARGAQTDAGEMECIIRRITIFHVPRSIFVLDIVTAAEMLRYSGRNTDAHPLVRSSRRGFSLATPETIPLLYRRPSERNVCVSSYHNRVARQHLSRVFTVSSSGKRRLGEKLRWTISLVTPDYSSFCTQLLRKVASTSLTKRSSGER